MAYQGIIRLNPFMDKFVYAVNTSEIIHFYKINNTDISLIKKYEMNYPIYKTQVEGTCELPQFHLPIIVHL